jgi:hypothetical protein
MSRVTTGVLAATVAASFCCVNGDALVVRTWAQATPATAEPGTTPAGRPPAPGLVFAFELHATVAAPTELGTVANGRRRIVEITGGRFEGPGINGPIRGPFKGKVRPGGADWQIVREDGLTELDTRYTLETDTGKLIYVQNAGMRHAPPDVMKKLLAGEPVDPARVYFRTVPKFEAAAPELQWLTRAVFIGVGERYPTEVVVRFWRVE